MLYAYPKLPWKYMHLGFIRISGAGLGNLLFPWARAVVAAKRYDMRLVWPTWEQLYLSKRPKLALEYIKRHYIGYFSPTTEYVSGLSKIILLLQKEKVSEDEFFADISYYKTKSNRDYVVIFEGMKDLFVALKGYHQLIKDHLVKITNPKHLSKITTLPWPSISVHIRFGDLPYTEDISLIKQNPWKFRLPLSWYIAQIEKLRELLGKRTPVYLFSDAKDWEIAPLFRIGNIYIFKSSAITDLITMSTSFVLIASGSTYSAWASFLGQCPTIWFQNWKLQEIVTVENGEIEIDTYDDLPKSFCILLQNRLLRSNYVGYTEK